MFNVQCLISDTAHCTLSISHLTLNIQHYTFMKKNFALLALVLAMTACSDDTAVQPTAAIELDKNIAEINESIVMHFTGSADNVVVFPGDEGQDYERLSEGNSGLVVNKGLFTYSYTTPGTYKFVCVATNHANEGQSLLSDTCSVWVRVVDDVTEITRLSAPQVLYDEVFATLHGDKDWVMALPKKMRFSNSDRNVALTQRLKFYIPSQTTQIFIDGAPYQSTTRYNLANVLEVKTVSHEGSERIYNLHTLNYGEFATFSIAGVAGTLQRTEFDYAYSEITLNLPAGTDVTALAPSFTLSGDNVKVYVGDIEQQSGVSTQDFTTPVTYRFVTTSTSDSSISVEAVCKVSVDL